jgi:hypothetical protein
LEIRNVFAIGACLLLVACGGNDSSQEESVVSDAPSMAEPEEAKPFAKEQQLIQDAKGVQALLEADAKKKKDAVSGMN